MAELGFPQSPGSTRLLHYLGGAPCPEHILITHCAGVHTTFIRNIPDIFGLVRGRYEILGVDLRSLTAFIRPDKFATPSFLPFNFPRSVQIVATAPTVPQK